MNRNNPIAIDTNLTLDVGDRRITISGSGAEVVITAPDFAIFLALLRSRGPLKGTYSEIKKLSQFLNRVGLRLTFRTTRRTLLTLGHPQGSRLLRLLGLPDARFSR